MDLGGSVDCIFDQLNWQAVRGGCGGNVAVSVVGLPVRFSAHFNFCVDGCCIADSECRIPALGQLLLMIKNMDSTIKGIAMPVIPKPGTAENADEAWTDEELRAAVLAYAEMQRKEKNGEAFVKVAIYRELSARYGRSPKAFEFRMQNISSVLDRMGRSWIAGLKPRGHSGSGIEAAIERLINDLDNDQERQKAIFAEQVRAGYFLPDLPRPQGQKRPTKRQFVVTKVDRDANVKAWVLRQARGRCECCGKRAPFTSLDNIPYLEVHHLHLLAEGGSDTPENAVAICPNCHRELHLGVKKDEIRAHLYMTIPRLVEE